MTQQRLAYFFGGGRADGDGSMKALLGGKGAGLAEMTRAGLPVPPGFTLTTATCLDYFAAGRRCPDAVDAAMQQALSQLEAEHGRKLGDPQRPLLLSVRSGSAVSMPGMMDTVLNLGLNQATVHGLAQETGNAWYAWDCYRRFVQMFGEVVLGADADRLEDAISERKAARGVQLDTELTVEDLQALVVAFRAAAAESSGQPFPDDPLEQLRLARDAVYRSWFNDRARSYRRIHQIDEKIGTAVTVQAMVFGNRGWRSGSGVGFTRDPSTGEKVLYGEYLLNAQGEDVVAGVRTPEPLERLRASLPEVHAQLAEVAARLEAHYRDVQDFEFTIEEGQLFMLQTRAGKRAGRAALKIALDLLDEGVVDEAGAVLLVAAEHVEQALHKVFAPGQQPLVLGRGLPASPGAAAGRIAFTAEDAVAMAAGGDPVVLVRVETSPEDIEGMHAAAGILTARGGMTSHAAVVARQMGTCCVAGCGEALIDVAQGWLVLGGRKLATGDWISLDGTAGTILDGRLEMVDPDLDDPALTRILSLADQFRRLGVRANADTPENAQRAAQFGAAGIGLCRTEHMFFARDRLSVVQRMIMSEDAAEREGALGELLPFQREDFAALFVAMRGEPVTIRLLDPPLHEFLPRLAELVEEVASLERAIAAQDAMVRFLEVSEADEATIAGVLEAIARGEETLAHRRALLGRARALTEMNPMLGHRGCRLGITVPGITRMQARAIFEAATTVAAEGQPVRPEIMIPLVGSVEELTDQRAIVDAVAEEVFAERGTRVDYLVGTMIELPRACVVADEIAAQADFFSFGTNDLTQTTFGFSRDDAGVFIHDYVDRGILTGDPFAHLDQKGVGRLVAFAVRTGRERKPGLKIGVCGEHGGDPSSVHFFHRSGLDYVSCSPWRVPVARMAAAHVALREAAEAAETNGAAST
ncbi:MAG: pyruvate, phosphate dikinase [Deltaproteobacteria bacterium]|nr:pyruvate, phosphate dikinase [Deltaproteobacteria bacterium]